jgi:hypothetical protein
MVASICKNSQTTLVSGFRPCKLPFARGADAQSLEAGLMYFDNPSQSFFVSVKIEMLQKSPDEFSSLISINS